MVCVVFRGSNVFNEAIAIIVHSVRVVSIAWRVGRRTPFTLMLQVHGVYIVVVRVARVALPIAIHFPALTMVK